MHQPPQCNWAIPQPILQQRVGQVVDSCRIVQPFDMAKRAVCSGGNKPPEDAASVVGYIVIGGPTSRQGCEGVPQ
jgi:hypothetical protein